MQTKLDSIIANVYDLDQVLMVLREKLLLKPFLTNTITLNSGKKARMALINVGNADLEFIECAESPLPSHMSRIKEVHLQLPNIQEANILELEKGLEIWTAPGKKSAIHTIICESTCPEKDVEVLLYSCDNCYEHPLPHGGRNFIFDDTNIQLLEKAILGNNIPKPKDLSTIHGWRRFSLHFKQLEEAVNLLKSSGAVVVVPIFQVMPGLREAMMSLPSGLIVQPVEQKLLRMMPTFFWQKLTEKKEKINA